MKKALCIVSVCLLFGLFLGGCGKTESDNSYYVRYEVAAKSLYFETAKIEVETETGKQTFNLTINPSSSTYFQLLNCTKVFSEQFGPVEKGFNAGVNASIVDASYNSLVTLEVAIYVSRGDEPFVLKASNRGGSSCNVSYSIDY